MASKIVLVLGAGSNVGANVASYFSKKTYKVAVVSRNPSREVFKTADLLIPADLTDLSTIPSIFAEVRSKLGVPNVVVYNGASSNLNGPDPFSIPVDKWAAGVNITTINAYSAVQQAIAGFKELPRDARKTFIYTGNACTHAVLPTIMNLGVGKNAVAHMVKCAVKVHEQDGFRFYYADQRQEDSTPMYTGLSGKAHAETYLDLAETAEQGPWEYTFAEGKGYIDFKGRFGA